MVQREGSLSRRFAAPNAEGFCTSDGGGLFDPASGGFMMKGCTFDCSDFSDQIDAMVFCTPDLLEIARGLTFAHRTAQGEARISQVERAGLHGRMARGEDILPRWGTWLLGSVGSKADIGHKGIDRGRERGSDGRRRYKR